MSRRRPRSSSRRRSQAAYWDARTNRCCAATNNGEFLGGRQKWLTIRLLCPGGEEPQRVVGPRHRDAEAADGEGGQPGGAPHGAAPPAAEASTAVGDEIGRASCRTPVVQYVSSSEAA